MSYLRKIKSKTCAARRDNNGVATGHRAKAVVFAGHKERTKDSLTKDGLKKNKKGRVVSKAASEAGACKVKYVYAWRKAVAAARVRLKVQGFCPVGGKTVRGKKLYKIAKLLLPRFQAEC